MYSGPVYGQPGGFVGCSVATCARRNTALFFTIDWFNVGVFSPGQTPPSLKRELWRKSRSEGQQHLQCLLGGGEPFLPPPHALYPFWSYMALKKLLSWWHPSWPACPCWGQPWLTSPRHRPGWRSALQKAGRRVRHQAQHKPTAPLTPLDSDKLLHPPPEPATAGRDRPHNHPPQPAAPTQDGGPPSGGGGQRRRPRHVAAAGGACAPRAALTGGCMVPAVPPPPMQWGRAGPGRGSRRRPGWWRRGPQCRLPSMASYLPPCVIDGGTGWVWGWGGPALPVPCLRSVCGGVSPPCRRPSAASRCRWGPSAGSPFSSHISRSPLGLSPLWWRVSLPCGPLRRCPPPSTEYPPPPPPALPPRRVFGAGQSCRSPTVWPGQALCLRGRCVSVCPFLLLGPVFVHVLWLCELLRG